MKNQINVYKKFKHRAKADAVMNSCLTFRFRSYEQYILISGFFFIQNQRRISLQIPSSVFEVELQFFFRGEGFDWILGVDKQLLQESRSPLYRKKITQKNLDKSFSHQRKCLSFVLNSTLKTIQKSIFLKTLCSIIMLIVNGIFHCYQTSFATQSTYFM